jgi:hypothetical protein
MTFKPLSQSQIDQRRAAARARWQKNGASVGAIHAAERAHYVPLGQETSPAELIGNMRHYGRTNRGERAIFATDDLKQVVARSIGNRLGITPTDDAQRRIVAKGPKVGMALLHNHPDATPISVADVQSLVNRETVLRHIATIRKHKVPVPKEKVDAASRQIKKTPGFTSIYAADPKGQVSSLKALQPQKDIYGPIMRTVALHQLMHHRYLARRDALVNPGDLMFHTAPMSHGHWRELHDQGVVDYRTTGNWSPAAERAGRKIARLAQKAKAVDVARWSLNMMKPTTPTKAALKDMARAIRVGGLFKRGPFDPNQHPRGHDGEFAPAERRSLTRGETWQRLGAKLPGLPSSYTGSRDKERPVGSFEKLEIVHQIPPGVTPAEHHHLFKSFVGIAKRHRKEIIDDAIKHRQGEKHVFLPAHERKDGGPSLWRMKPDKFPEGTPRGLLNRAYDHASLLAIHDHGPIRYDFKMDDHLKGEMKPLAPFILYARRRVGLEIHKQHKGHRIVYQRAFGTPFKDRRTHPDGEVRRRLKPNLALVKREAPDLARSVTPRGVFTPDQASPR